MASLGEEVGWRGYLLPRLAPRWGLVPAALAIGLLWGLWHLPADYIALKAYGPLFWLAFLINGPIVLTAHSIIVSVLWARSARSLLVALLYHWGITFSAIVAPSVGGESPSALAASAVGAAAVWIAAAIALFVHRSTVSTQSMADTA
jgi:membrane protease YdiL (CAAX protease family)